MTNKNSQYRSFPDTTPEKCLEAVKQTDGDEKEAAKSLGMPQSTFRRRLRAHPDIESIEHMLSLARSEQRARDLNRIKNKNWREFTRYNSAIEDFCKEITRELKGYKFSQTTKPKKEEQEKATKAGVIQISDHHLNERVSLPHNTFDWDIASKRLHKYADQVILQCQAQNINTCLVAMTGDLLNSDRRLDELLANANNRSKACVLAVDLYQQFLRHLSEHLEITVASISGNESRMSKEIGYQEEVASDNYDFTIFEFLRMLLDDEDNISFIAPKDPSRCIVQVAGQRVLLTHGHGDGGLAKGNQKQAQAVAGLHSLRGEPIDFVIFGHVHEALISDTFGRSSSLVGSNTFNENALGLYGRASQNFYIVHKEGGFDGIKFDLQSYNGYEGYDLKDRMKRYNTKSAEKSKPQTTIVKVTI